MSEQQTTDRRIYKWRPMRGMKASSPYFLQIGHKELKLSDFLADAAGLGHDRIIIAGSLQEMSREYVEEPIAAGWEFARPYIHKFRSPVYRSPEGYEPKIEISVKLAGESWFPGCESAAIAFYAWAALEKEWSLKTNIPLLSTPTKTGQALLHESFPDGEFPSLPDGLAQLIRGISPQHRLQVFSDVERSCGELYSCDGRWMYAGACLTDRLPVGEARKVGGFRPFQPGWHHVVMRVPQTWAHIGLIPAPVDDMHGSWVWEYPNEPGQKFEAWASEPELTFALEGVKKLGLPAWEILEHRDGYEFDKGKPLARWAKKLIRMRENLQEGAKWGRDGDGPFVTNYYDYAAAACREMLNHTIGSFHVNTFEREAVVKAAEHKELVAQRGFAKVKTLKKMRGGKRRVIYPEKTTDRLSIYMPHWSAQIWALERAWMARHALMVDPAALVEIRGDAIYSTQPLPFDAGENANYSQLRAKEVG